MEYTSENGFVHDHSLAHDTGDLCRVQEIMLLISNYWCGVFVFSADETSKSVHQQKPGTERWQFWAVIPDITSYVFLKSTMKLHYSSVYFQEKFVFVFCAFLLVSW